MPPQQPQGLNMMPTNKGNGALIGSVIVIVILVGIAAYLVSSKKAAPVQNQPSTAQTNQPAQNTDNSIAASTSAAVSNADLEAIEKTLASSNIDLETDFKAFDSAK